MSRRQFFCEICHRSISVGRYRQYRICTRGHCRISWNREFWNRVRKGALRNRQEMRRAAQLLQPAAVKLVPAAGEDYLPVVVPANTKPVVPLSPDRRRAFRDHLSQQMQQLGSSAAHARTETEQTAEHQTPDSDPVLLNVCATCQGRCCKPGYNSGKISTHTLKNYMARYPALSADEVIQAYLSFLPTTAVEDSCVFHGETGCALPRAMRSVTCNTYMCDNLRIIQEELQETNPGHLLVISAIGKSPQRASYIDGPQVESS